MDYLGIRITRTGWMPDETRAAGRASDTEKAAPTVMFARAGSMGSPQEGAKRPIGLSIE